MTTCGRMELDPYFISPREINSKRVRKIKYESIKLLERWTFMKVIWAIFWIYWVTIRSTGKQSQVRWIPHQIKMPLTKENKSNRDKRLPMEYGEVCSYPTITHYNYVSVAWHITLDEVPLYLWNLQFREEEESPLQGWVYSCALGNNVSVKEGWIIMKWKYSYWLVFFWTFSVFISVT